MRFDPKCYYPGGWHIDEETGERRKQIYSWEALEPSETGDYELLAVKAGPENGFFVIDLDKVTDEAARFIEHWGIHSTGTRRVKTPSGGCHWFFELPAGVELPRKIGFVPGIDLLGRDMVFTPPSAGYEVHEGGDEIKPAPAGLIDFIQHRPSEGVSEGAAPRMGGEIPAGERNQRLFEQGMALRKRHNLDQRDIESILLRENDERCRPPLGRLEVGHIAASVAGYSGGLEEELDPEDDWQPLTTDQLKTFSAALPPCEQVMGPFQTGTWGIVYAPPGAGKSRFMQAMAWHIAKGADFFAWKAGKPRSVYLLDAEMSTFALTERTHQWPEWPETVVYDTLQHREAHNLPMFELGSSDHTAWFKRKAGSYDVVIIDNIEATLIPHSDGLWSPSTWAQTKGLRDWATTSNKLLIFVDHSNAQGHLAGSQSKTRGSWLNLKLERISDAGDEDKLRFVTELTKPARNDMDASQICRYEWWVDAGQRWHQQRCLTPVQWAQELRDQGANASKIAEITGKSVAWVYKKTTE